jgi:uncharacterized protein
MPAERPKLFAMQTSKRIALTVAAITGGLLAYGPGWPTSSAVPPGLGLVSPAAARDLGYKSTKDAYEQGLGAYRSGYYEIAIPALEHVVAKNDPTYRFFAEFYLGRIFADNAGSHPDPAKAYMLFQRLADEFADIDPDDLKRAPFVAKALTTVAIYVREGVPEIALKPDEQRAIEYLRHAATFFNEPDAQFELAKIYITDPQQRQTGVHFLQKLSQESHAGAQAVLADMLARGKYIAPDQTRAFGLIKMAVENAPSPDRIWIEDIYQSIFCGSSKEVREKSKSLVAQWRQKFALPRAAVEQPMGLGRRGDGIPTRVCSNGERLDLNQGAAGTGGSAQGVAAAPPTGALPGSTLGFVPANGKPPVR